MRIVLDGERCQGHGRCYVLAPELFDADDDGYAVVTADGELTDAQLTAARLAVDNCPEFALSVEP